MCVVACKKLPETGWVGIKNRDRNYKPIVSFFQSNKKGVERLLFRDDLTGYMEGINEFGLSVISSATAVKDDETQLLANKKKQSDRREIARLIRQGEQYAITGEEDEKKLGDILLSKNIKDAIKLVKETKPIGNHIIFDRDDCYAIEIDLTREEKLEACKIREEDPDWEHPSPKDRDYVIKVKQLKDEEFVLRTNHGVLIDSAGYQEDTSKMTGDISDEEYLEWMKENRKGSISRYNIAEKGVKKAKSVQDMIDALSDRPNENPQLNPLRLASRRDKKSLRTTGQMVLVPAAKVFKYRNIWSKISDMTDINKINGNNSKTYLELLSFHKDIYTESTSKFNSLVDDIILG